MSRTHQFLFHNTTLSGGGGGALDLSARWWNALRTQVNVVLDEEHTGTARDIQPGRAMQLDGTNDYIRANLAAPITYPFSVAIWANHALVPGGFSTVWSIEDPTVTDKSFRLQLVDVDGSANVVRNNQSDNVSDKVIPITTLELNEWHHHVTVFPDQFTLIHYLDGVEIFNEVSNPGGAPLDEDFLALILGMRGFVSPADFLGGRLFDARLYSTNLSPEQVAEIFNTSRPDGRPETALFADDLAGHWRLDDIGTVASVASVNLDSSGNEQHAWSNNTTLLHEYLDSDVPFSWWNEHGHSLLSLATAPSSWTVLLDDNFPSWVAGGTDGNAIALTGQTWRGSIGLNAAQFLDGALAGDAQNHVRIDIGDEWTMPADSIEVVYMEIALSRELAAGEEIEFQTTMSGPKVTLGPSTTDLTKWNPITLECAVIAVNTSQRFYIAPTANITGGDLTIYLRNVRYWNTGIAATPGVGGVGPHQHRWPLSIPRSSASPMQTIYGLAPQFLGQVRRNARLHSSSCASFDGVDGRVTIPASLSFPSGADARVYTGWTRYLDIPATEPAASRIFTASDSAGVGEAFRIGMYTSGDFGFAVDFEGRRLGTGFTPRDRWFHWAVRVPNGATNCDDVDIFIDGELFPATVISGANHPIDTTANQTHLIGHATTEAPLMRAKDFRIYDIPLSDSDIALLAQGKEPTTEPLTRWPLAEGDGTIAWDVMLLEEDGQYDGGVTFDADDDLLHYNLRYGYHRNGLILSPAEWGNANFAANGVALTGRSILGHNGAETLVDFTGGVPEAPWLDPERLRIVVPTDYAFGDDLPDGMTKETDNLPLREWDFRVGQPHWLTEIFEASGTWTKPAGAVSVQVVLLGGGGGGGSGRRGGAGNPRGGGGGGGGGISYAHFDAATLGDTETVTVGAGGTGGAARTVDGQNGLDGTAGGATSFGAHLTAGQGGGGIGGAATDQASGSAGTGTLRNGGSGGDSVLSGTAIDGVKTGFAGGGGGAGESNSSGAPGTGGFTVQAVTDDPGGFPLIEKLLADAASDVSIPTGGAGGTGGTFTSGAVGTAGEPGALYGGGGGGGGASPAGFNSGAGGDGADGVAIVITYFE